MITFFIFSFCFWVAGMVSLAAAALVAVALANPAVKQQHPDLVKAGVLVVGLLVTSGQLCGIGWQAYKRYAYEQRVKRAGRGAWARAAGGATWQRQRTGARVR